MDGCGVGDADKSWPNLFSRFGVLTRDAIGEREREQMSQVGDHNGLYA